ncbi:hypothetical protein BASA82_000345 [Batrachochytrium salamandrivorans]|uniref:MORN repeat-containing protein 5 n=1 Tax=Batrachochytrium salamandrivorans TaxID=1357716 RepID=A0ABQ8F262_9FUNG|nr:hypothetical protein BASA62_000575 [Batrachochytrium salamandrivorans]KAH6583708.1 hypothetical protein BASA60_001306 [Batrachochytrium salamandrivorans]KAH6589268.1 hypothetical protein BASA50_010143 [Batrachochytrium salamandrivorans]KAH6590802.1 hypothetical protein BASA61_005139 [Batrachochytrium salamandrivorans]KAH9258789.1 hypothetical protein BASA81_002853 [Batrachochytrium salamandrivorans]
MAFRGSPFDAEIVNERIEGEGKYTFPNGNIYIGHFKDGKFHGFGTIYFCNGGKLMAQWTHGVASEEKYTFGDGLGYSINDWDYCTEKDRRFYSERVNGFFQGKLQLSNDLNGTPVTPIMTKDIGYCYYSKEDGRLHSFEGDHSTRDPSPEEMKWIKQRTADQV